jgi:RNA polymerase sigma-70 factor (ECF subfamily)
MRFDELIENLHDEIFTYVWRLVGASRCRTQEAEDLVQETFLRAYRNFSSLRPDSNHRAWLYKIATNCALTHLKRENRRATMSTALEAEPEIFRHNGALPDEHVSEKRVIALIAKLPARQKICVTLRYLEEFDYPEIARTVGCSEASVRANVYQAIRRLRRELQQERR